MKLTLSCLLFAAFIPSGYAAYTQNFNAATVTNPGDVVPFNVNFATANPVDQEGWTISDPQTPISFLVSSIPSYGKAVGLGGLYAFPASANNISLVRDVPSQAAIGSVFSVDFALVNRYAAVPASIAPFVPNNDKFGFTISNGGTSLLTIEFLTTTGNNKQLSHNGTAHPVSGVIASDYDSLGFFNLSVSFTDGGNGDLNYSGAIAGGPIAFSGIILGGSGANITKIGADFDIAGATGPDAGSNFILFDNVSLVPEPNAALMGLLSLGLLGVRRRR